MTSLPILAHTSRITMTLADRLLTDRTRSPLFLAYGVSEALKFFGIKSRVMFGNAMWLEVMDDHTVLWAGAFGEQMHFWVETEFHETVDLYVGAAHRAESGSHQKAMFSPPNLWSKEIPGFYKYQAEGIAEAESLDDPTFQLYMKEIREQCATVDKDEVNPNFFNEPFICNDRKLMDDSKGSFKLFERAIQVRGIPKPPSV